MSEDNDEFIEELRSHIEDWNIGLQELQVREPEDPSRDHKIVALP
jgi:hypothetical protein